MSSPINVVPKLAELSKSAPASLEKSSWNSREVSSPYFVDLPFDMQNCISKELDDSTRMSLYLTCKVLYYKPERPRMLWREFAKAAMLEGNIDLVKFGLELGIELDYFMEHAQAAAERNYRQIFEIKEIKQHIEKNKVPTFFFVPALAYAAEHDLFDEYEWMIQEFNISEATKQEGYLAGYLRASNLKALKECKLYFSCYHYEQAFKYANLEVIDWLLKIESFTQSLGYEECRHLGSRKEFELVGRVYMLSPLCIGSIVEDAVYYDNVGLLVYLMNLKHFDVTEVHLSFALRTGSFHVFDWLLQHVEWCPDYFPREHYNEKYKGREFPKKWLSDVLQELDKHGLPYDLNEVPIRYHDFKTFFDKLSEKQYASYRLKIIRAPDNHQLINCLFDHLNDAIAFAILTCPEASFSQIMRVLESPWAKQGDNLKNLGRSYKLKTKQNDLHQKVWLLEFFSTLE